MDTPPRSNVTEDRIEHDSLGEVRVPGNARWGAQTQRAVENFPISGQAMPSTVIRMLGWIKASAARVNGLRGDIPGFDAEIAAAVESAALEVAAGQWADQFPIDVYQTGSGTSTNMNVNEVIAHLAAQRCGRPVHPNDHVNAAQSSNDVMPTAIRLATALQLRDTVGPAIRELARVIDRRASEAAEIVKAGRTHLMDAAPLFVGDEMGAWAAQLDLAEAPLRAAVDALCRVPLGGSAVGTGLNVPPGWADAVIAHLSTLSGLTVTPAANRFALMAGAEAYAEASAALRGVAASLCKIANDLRWLSSGPFTGLAELRLPELQPGSSIMPGKVNPVIAEAAVQVAARVAGNDVTIGIAAASGNLQLNTYQPLVAATLDESSRLIANVANVLAERCVAGLEIDAERCRRYAEASPALVTGLSRSIGYEPAAAAVHGALHGGPDLRAALANLGLSDAEIAEALDPVRLARGDS